MERIWTLANLITMSRIAGTIPLFYYIVDRQWTVAFWVFFIVGITDKLDGLIARQFNQRTKLGARLDPMVDYFMLGFITIGVLITGPWWFRGVVLVAFARLIAVFCLAARRRSKDLPDLEVNHDGKVTMVAVCFSLASFMLYHGGANPAYLFVAIGFFAVWAFFGHRSLMSYQQAASD